MATEPTSRQIGLMRIRQCIQKLDPKDFDPTQVEWTEEIQHYLRMSLYSSCTTILWLNKLSNKVSPDEFCALFRSHSEQTIEQLHAAGIITKFLLSQAKSIAS